MQQGFEKRRLKIADAEVRAIASRRKEELEKVRDQLAEQMKKLTGIEDQLV